IQDKASLLPYLAQAAEGREFAGEFAALGGLRQVWQQAAEGRDFASVHPVSALQRKGLDGLVDDVIALLPEQDALYGEDEITDRSQRFLAAELVREQLMRQLGAELPYATTVEIESFVEEPSPRGGVMLRIGAVVWV